ncbi:MAG: hypothetical protein JWQ70_2477, partial [Aeromicrobium sp.]|nr:hypothetical protein [Aeromicrobium sp.]
MRVHLEEWLLGDGQLPDPEVGATLYGVAILVRCESSSLSSGVDEVVAAPKPDEDPTSSSRVTLDGTVVWRDDGAIAAVIRVGDRLIALETEHRDYPSDWDPEVGDWDDVVRTTIDVPTAEERVRVVGNAAVMPEHELEDGYLLTDPWTTEIQDTWDVVGITLVEHGPFGVGVVASKPVDRAESWTHVDQPVSYVLDLEPSATAYDRAKAAADAPWNAARVVDYLVRRSPRLRTYDADPDPETRLRSVVTSLVADLDGPLRRPRLRALDRALRRADHATAWIVTETLGTEVFKGRPPSEWTAAMRGWPRSVVDRMVLVVEVLELQGDGYDDPT